MKLCDPNAEEVEEETEVHLHVDDGDGDVLIQGEFIQGSPSLFRSQDIPCLIRWGLPTFLLGQLVLLLYSNVTVGAEVHLRVYDGQGRMIESPVLYNVSLGNSIIDMWNAEAYALSSLIAVFSGAWPHLKLLTSLCCWFLDETWLLPRWRTFLLLWTYRFQKYSHIETFVLVIMMNSFSFTAKLPNYEDWGVKTYVKSQASFYCFLSALILSMILSRIALHHNNIHQAQQKSHLSTIGNEEEAPASSSLPPSLPFSHPSEQLSLQSSEDGRSSSCNSRSGRRRRRSLLLGLEPIIWQEIIVCFFLVSLGALMVLALITPAFRFHYEGLAGWILSNIAKEDAYRSATVISLGQDVSIASDTSQNLGIRYIQAAYMAFVVVCPLGCLIGLLALMLVPVESMRWILIITEILYAWAAPDVLFVSLVASTFAMKLFVQFVIGDKCDAINAILRKIMDKELDGDDKCFDLSTALKPGSWLLGTCSLVFFVTGYLILSHMRKRFAKEEDDDGNDDGNDPLTLASGGRKRRGKGRKADKQQEQFGGENTVSLLLYHDVDEGDGWRQATSASLYRKEDPPSWAILDEEETAAAQQGTSSTDSDSVATSDEEQGAAAGGGEEDEDGAKVRTKSTNAQ